ncbi:MAG: hypothetical protein WAL71_10650 [Terriglobales bacterium]|jgi:F0F1-type ATP synthase membrane subunit c/vacuolar-type H+-ATPase subunit K
MATERRFNGKKLAIIAAFAVLLVAAFGAGCKGFFTSNTIQSIAVQPATVNLQVNGTQVFTAWGTDQSGNRSQITSGLVWSSGDPSVSITSGGTATGLTVTSSAVTITGSAEGLSGTATVNVIGNVTTITGTDSATSIKAGGDPVYFTFAGNPGPPDFITVGDGGTLVITTADSFFVCTDSTYQNNPAESCSLTQGGTATSYQLYMTYPTPSGGTATSNTLTITATQ